MGMFNIREPKKFEHKYIYYDERKEKLAKIEERAKRELGMLEEEPYDPEKIRGRFVEQTKHLKRYKESGANPVPAPVKIIMIVGLCLFLRYLLTGVWLF